MFYFVGGSREHRTRFQQASHLLTICLVTCIQFSASRPPQPSFIMPQNKSPSRVPAFLGDKTEGVSRRSKFLLPADCRRKNRQRAHPSCGYQECLYCFAAKSGSSEC